ncbi:MAG: serine hydrolase [Eubacterium sp.]|nr:serine hydrolase [Eubacterium sp.]
MKKSLSVLFALIILAVSVLSVPATGFAQEQNAPMYTVTSKVYADSYMLINLDDDNYPVIAAKNQNKKKFPASLTKIATAMVAINNVKNLKKKTKVSKHAIEMLSNTGAQVANLKVGEELTVEQLLYLTLVHSACDACEVLAECVGGSTDKYVEMMNKWAKSVGCKNTNFVNADGLHDNNQYTTASDLAKMTLAAMKNETFAKISTTKSYEYDGVTFIHTNFMLDEGHVSYYYEYAEGIKTGSTDEAGYCVITKAAKDGYNYLAIVLDSPIKKFDGIETKCSFIDAATLFDWAFDSLKYSTVIRMNDLVDEVSVKNGKDADTVQLVAEKDVTTLVPASLDPSAVMIKPVNPPKELKAPVSQGEKVCEAQVIYADKVIANVDLVAATTVELSTFLGLVSAIKGFFSNKVVIALFALAVVLGVLYVAVFLNRLRKDKRRIAEKRRRQRELEDQINEEYYGRDDYLSPPKRRK